ncbi:MAG: hypothetical protein HFG29_10190 [Eubacterium sp.]|nr:hypothetical protein [Eubacterium sp.]
MWGNEELGKKIYSALLECWENSTGQKIISIEYLEETNKRKDRECDIEK